MTITAGAIKTAITAGDGATVAFTFTFKAYATTDIKVYKILNSTGVKTLQTLTTNYTVSLSTTGAGGTVTYVVAPTALQSSLIVLDIPSSQAASLITNGKFRDETVETMIDKLTLLIEQAEEALDRCLKVGVENDNPAVLPEFGTTAGYIYWNGTTFEIKTP